MSKRKKTKLNIQETKSFDQPSKADPKAIEAVKKHTENIDFFWRHNATLLNSQWGPNRFADFTDPDPSILFDHQFLRSYAEELFANHATFKSIINLTVTAATPGLFQFAMDLPNAPHGSDRARINDEIQRHFKKWSKDCDAAGYQDFNELAESVIFNLLLYGESFAIIVGDKKSANNGGYATKLRGIAPSRIGNPGADYDRDQKRMRDGVEVSGLGDNPKNLWIRKGTGAGTGEFTFIPYYDSDGFAQVCHCFKRFFNDQTRGLNPVAAVYKMMYNLSRFVESEVQAAVVGSQINVIPTLNNPDSITQQNGKVANDILTPGRKREVPVVSLDAGKWFILEQGEKFEQFKLERPTAAFAPFVDYLQKQICAAYGYSRSYIFAEWEQNNYTSARLSALQTQSALGKLQKMVIKSTLDPLVRKFLYEICSTEGMVDIGDVEIEEILESYSIIPPSMPLLDPQKEAAAWAFKVQNMFATREQATKALDNTADYSKNIQQLGREEKEIREAGLVPPIAPGSQGQQPPSQDGTTDDQGNPNDNQPGKPPGGNSTRS